MRYLEVLLGWCGLNLYMFLVVYVINYPIIDFMAYYFIGAFLITIFWYIDLWIKTPINSGYVPYY